MSFWSSLASAADATPGVNVFSNAVQGNFQGAGLNALTGGLYGTAQAAGGTLGAVKNAINVSTLPGVGGAAANPANLRQQPDGSWLDPSTGTSYTDPQGTQPVVNQNLAQAAATAQGRARGFLAKAAQSDPTLDAVNARQNTLASTLQNTISNPNAPSVAQAQLQQSADQNARRVLGTVAGVGGNNQFDARRAALSALATSGASLAGDAAVLRQKEIADATGALAGVNNAQATQAQNRQNSNVQAGATFAGQGLTAQSDKDQIDAKIKQGNQDTDQKYVGAGLKGLSAIGGALA